MAEPIIVYRGSIGQDLTDQLKYSNGKPIPAEEIIEVKFNMRFADSDVLKIEDDPATIMPNGEVTYNFNAGSLGEAGEFFGWWEVTLINNDTVDTNEFPIIVSEHRPSLRTETGSIFEYARSEIPYTWDALQQSDKYGDKFLQRKVEVAKLRVLNQEILPENEDELDIRVQDYLGKVSALYVIPAGIDYWMVQHDTITTGGGGTTEVASYPDRIEALKETYRNLLIQVKNLEDEIDGLIDNPTLVSNSLVPAYLDAADIGFVTPSPNRHFRDYGHSPDIRRDPLRNNWFPWDL